MRKRFAGGGGADSDLGRLIENLEESSYNAALAELASDYDDYLRFYNLLCPEATFASGRGDCKSLAVISVAYKRIHGIPARFLRSEKNHMIFEECNGEVWIPKEPQMSRFSKPLTCLFEPVEPIRNDELYNRVYLEVVTAK